MSTMTTATENYNDVTITVHVLENNLFPTTDGINTRESVLKYCTAIESEMEKEFPGITVDHNIQWNTEGSASATTVSDWDREEEIKDGYEAIAERVFNNFELWLVEEAA